MTIEGFHNYLSARLALQLNARQHFRLLRTMFALAFAGTVVIHLLIQPDESLFGLFVHATAIGLLYAVGVGIASVLLYALRDASQDVRVWHLWFASMVGFVLGYYFLPINDVIIWLLDVDTNSHTGATGFWQLSPIWFLATYLFVQPYLNEGLKSELARLRDINALLEQRGPDLEQSRRKLIRFESGRTEFSLEADSIRNVVVEDHYCYVHFEHDGVYAKRDLAVPLHDVQALLPSGFVQVHRSHIVNPAHITSIRRKNRNIRVILDSGYEVPVSRHRLDDVLPVIQQRIALLGHTTTPKIEAH
jgi:hypothetical protein